MEIEKILMDEQFNLHKSFQKLQPCCVKLPNKENKDFRLTLCRDEEVTFRGASIELCVMEALKHKNEEAQK